MQLDDLIDHIVRFRQFAAAALMDDLGAIPILGIKLLIHTGLIVPYDAVGSGKDIVGGTVILIKDDGPGIGIVLVHIHDDIDIGTPPGEDGLIRIADDIEVVMASRQLPDQQILFLVHVLKLIDMDVVETGGPFFLDLREHFK